MCPKSYPKITFGAYDLVLSQPLSVNSFFLPETGKSFHFQTYLCVWKRKPKHSIAEDKIIRPKIEKLIPAPLSAIFALHSLAQLDPAKDYIIIRNKGNMAGRNGFVYMKGLYFEYRFGKFMTKSILIGPPFNRTHTALEFKSSYATPQHYMPYIEVMNHYKQIRDEKRPNFNRHDIYQAIYALNNLGNGDGDVNNLTKSNSIKTTNK